MSKSTLSQLDPRAGLEDWLRSFGVGPRVQAIVIHHTWSPTAAQYKGRSTIEGIRRYHIRERGWSDIGANLYACPDGTVITGRPLDAPNWAHAQVSLSRPEAEAKALSGGDAGWFNRHAVGIETVANFDVEPPDSGPSGAAYQVMLQACAAICRVFSLDPRRHIFFHRDVAAKSCPGTGLNRATVRAQVAALLEAEGIGVVRLGGPGGTALIPCNPTLSNGRVWVDLRPFVEGVGGEARWSPLGIIVLDDNGDIVDLTAVPISAGKFYRAPLRELAAAVGWPVKDPVHLDWRPPRVYVHRQIP